MNKIELLAPAGDLERLKIALLYGADAVYIGGKNYSLRANANNFGLDEISEAVEFAHHLGKKVYLTLNIVFHNDDITGVYDYIDNVVKSGIDAFIVSDPFIIAYIKNKYTVEVHLSTQNSTTNFLSVKYFKRALIDRVVLARELSKEEIKKIIDTTKMDVEVFIHGAMCTCYSGRCALSNYVSNRDSNRGGCSQVCRFLFEVNDSKPFTMATKDLNMANYISDLIEIGVKSLKIEGRMRSAYYLATVISSYRRLIDYYYSNSLTIEKLNAENVLLQKVANRENSTHYFNKIADDSDQYFSSCGEVSNQDFLGLVIGYRDNKLIISQRNYFKLYDQVDLFTPNGKIYTFTIDKMYNEVGEISEANHPEEIIYVPFLEQVPVCSMVRKAIYEK